MALEEWSELAVAFGLFLASHILPARPCVRARLVRILGSRAYLSLYVAVSVGLLGWLIDAAGRAPFIPLWDFALWQLWVPNLAMPVACLLAAFGVGARNPLSIADGPSSASFDPDTPGIAGVTRHPLLWALALWSAAHLVPNGDLAHVLLFGTFTVFALIGMPAIDSRIRKRVGHATWHNLARRTSLLPLQAWLGGRWRPRSWRPQPLRLLTAAGLYAVLFALHPWFAGVPPDPMP